MRKVITIICTIFVICFWSIYVYAENLQNLQNQSSELQDKINNENLKLEDLRQELSQNLLKVMEYDENIEALQGELDKLNSQIEEKNKSIIEAEEKLNTIQQRYDSQKQLVEKRLIYIYENGETSYLEVLINSASLKDFLSKYYYLSELATNDRKILQEVNNELKTISETKKWLSEQKNELTNQKTEQMKNTKIIENTKTVRQHYIEQLSAEEQNIQKQIDEYTTQFQQVEIEIKALTKQEIPTEYTGGKMLWPVPGYTRITSQYGMRTHPITGIYKLHTGVDIGAPMGANFIAAADGTVIKAGYNNAYGNMVIIDHGGGIQTLYAHGSEILVQLGQTVKQGEAILKVGSTGYSTGPHAHFEVRINGNIVNPMEWITTSSTTNNTILQTNTTDNNNVIQNNIQK